MLRRSVRARGALPLTLGWTVVSVLMGLQALKWLAFGPFGCRLHLILYSCGIVFFRIFIFIIN